MTLRKALVLNDSGNASELAATDALNLLSNIATTPVAGDYLEVFSATGPTFVARSRKVAMNATNSTVAGTTLGNVAGLSVTLGGVGNYIVEGMLLVTQTVSAGTFGLGLAMSGGATPQITLGAEIWSAATTAPAQRSQTAFPPTAMVGGATAAASSTFLVKFKGTVFIGTAAGVLTVQAQRSAGTTTVLAGSYIECFQLN